MVLRAAAVPDWPVDRRGGAGVVTTNRTQPSELTDAVTSESTGPPAWYQEQPPGGEEEEEGEVEQEETQRLINELPELGLSREVLRLFNYMAG